MLAIAFLVMVPASFGPAAWSADRVVAKTASRSQIADFRAVVVRDRLEDRTVLMWRIVGDRPDVQRIEWDGYSIEVDGDARSVTLSARDSARLVVVGDSMSDGVSADGTWPAKVATRLGRSLTTVALYAAGSKQVYRSGARPLLLTLAGNRLPADGQPASVVEINGAVPGKDNPASPLFTFANDMTPGSIAGTLRGRHVTLSTIAKGSGVYTIVGDAGAADVAVPPRTKFVPDFAKAMAQDEMLIWVSQNHFYSGVLQNLNGAQVNVNVAIFEEIAAMIRQGRGQRIVLLGLLPDASWTPGTPQYGAVRAFNAELRRRWPQYYAVDAKGRDLLARMLASGNGSPEDVADVHQGVTPRSKRRDSLHLNDAGNTIVADFVLEARQAQRSVPVVVPGRTRFTIFAGTSTKRTLAVGS